MSSPMIGVVGCRRCLANLRVDFPEYQFESYPDVVAISRYRHHMAACILIVPDGTDTSNLTSRFLLPDHVIFIDNSDRLTAAVRQIERKLRPAYACVG